MSGSTLDDPSEPENSCPTPDRSGGAEAQTVSARRGRWLAVGSVLAATAAAAVMALRGRPDEPAAVTGLVVSAGAVEIAASSPQMKYIEIATAARGEPLPPLPAPARVAVDERRTAPVFAPLPGRVERIAVQLGQEVKTGDRLVAVRSSALPELRRAVESARAALAVKSAIGERVRDLVELRAVPEKDLALAEQELHEAELTLRAAEGKQRSLRVNALDGSGLYWVTAPRKGTVVDRHALVGMEVGPDRPEPLLAIADLSVVVVVADALERDTVGLGLGDRARITDGPAGGLSVEGEIEYIAHLVDSVRRTVAVRVRAANPDSKLRPNAFAQVVFADHRSRQIVISSDAVVTDDQKAVIFVRRAGVGQAIRLERREVVVGRIRDGRTEILSGLADGEPYVSRGALLLLNALDLAS